MLVRDEPVCWEIEYGGEPIGHAVSQAVPGALGTTEIHSRVLLEGIEIRELAPQWMGSLVRGMGEISLDTRSRDGARFARTTCRRSKRKVRLNDLPLVMKVQGRVDGPELLLKIQSGEVTHAARATRCRSNSLLTSELIPEPKLLQVYVGRKWQQEMYSPFRPPSEFAGDHAGGSGRGRLDRASRRADVDAGRSNIRSMSPAGVAADNTLRAVVWVADDGTVLRQDVLFDGRASCGSSAARRAAHARSWPRSCWIWKPSPR